MSGTGNDDFELLDSRLIHDGRIVRLSIDRVRFPDGSTGELEMIRHSGASAVVPFLDPPDSSDPRIVLIHQLRYAADGYLYEIPAGRPDRQGEPWEQCAQRELEEETGYRAGQLLLLTSILTTPGFTDERIHIFLAYDLEPGTISRDTDEFMEICPMPISEVLAMIEEGQITDAKTISSVLLADRRRRALRAGPD